MDETLGSSWNGMPLVGGHWCSNKEMDEMLDSLWDSGSKVTETCSTVRAVVMSLSDDDAFLKFRDFLVEYEKKAINSTYFQEKTWSWRKEFLQMIK